MRSRPPFVVLAALGVAFASGCGEKSGLEIEDVTCGELRTKENWTAVATAQADVITDGDPRPETVKEFEAHFRTACAGKPDDFKPLARVTELREQGGS